MTTQRASVTGKLPVLFILSMVIFQLSYWQEVVKSGGGGLNWIKTHKPLFFLTAEVYIGIGKPAEATACTQEAANLFPMSHNVLYMRGQGAELRGNIDEAKRWYEEALSISPTHVKSMQRLVSPNYPQGHWKYRRLHRAEESGPTVNECAGSSNWASVTGKKRVASWLSFREKKAEVHR